MDSALPPTDGSSIDIPELPTLEEGLTLVQCEDDPRLVLQTLAVDKLLLEGGDAIWLGTGHYATTETLVEVAPDRRILDRVQVARAFQAYEHTTLVRRLEEIVDNSTAVIIVPDIDACYRNSDVQGADGQEMLVRSLAPLARIAREHEIPVLCTRTRDDDFSEPVEAAASSTLVSEETPMGPRFVGEEFETLVYPLGDGWVQTTLAFWRRILEARKPIHSAATWNTEVYASGAN